MIQLVKSLRARTPVAPKLLPKNHISKADPSETFSYYTPKGRKRSFPRWKIVRRNGKPIYHKPNSLKDTYEVIKTAAAARKKWGQIKKWGLARQSWGWFMQSLFNRSNPDAKNPKVKITRDIAEASPIREIVTGNNPRCEVSLWNKLRFMRDILPDGAMEEAMRAATNAINGQFDAAVLKARKELE